MFITILFFVLLISPFHAGLLLGQQSNRFDEKALKDESAKMLELSYEYAKFYDLPSGQDIQEITEQLLESPLVRNAQKRAIRKFNRRIFLFTYPSDGLNVKGLISFVPDFQNHPLLVFLRGGNRMLALPNPGNEIICPTHLQHTLIATMYRDGVSEGIDEFGGDDVNDVKNLIDFLPSLEKQLSLDLQNKKMFLLAESRGSMQMFLALARFPELQTRFSKIVSLSGMLDIRQMIACRPDMEEMFIEDFGLKKGMNEEEWLNRRDPLLACHHLNPELPILIIQGTDDNRVSLEEGYHMVHELQSHGHDVTYWEIEGGTHCLRNIKDRMKLILNWLEKTE